MALGYFIISLILSLALTPLVAVLMRRFKLVDRPEAAGRKIHSKPVPLGGGLVIFIIFFGVAALAGLTGGQLLGEDVSAKNLFGLFIGAAVLMVGGLLDDKYNLRPSRQIWFPVAAALTILAFGIGPHVITNPFGGQFDLSRWRITVDGLGNVVVFADAVVFVWLIGMMFTTKFLDGLDGLVTGIVVIGALALFFLSRDPRWYQPEVAMLSLIFAGACLGFLVWNWHPAKIFLGEGGSLMTGFVLGALAIISGGKIATTLLVMGLPALDVLRVIVSRLRRRRSIFHGDDEHLHFRLLRSGFSHRQAVLLMYSISLVFGMSALFLQSTHKLLAFILLFLVMILVAGRLVKKS